MKDIQLDEDKECPKCQTEIPRNFNVAASSSSDRESLKKLKNFQKSCDSFLMALVSKLCFNSNTAPDDDVVNRLMGYVTVKTTTRGLNAQQLLLTKPMSLFNHEIDPTPICRFFLLKLLTRKR
ncbi:hypothetical protein SNE40_019796 [Patella caerulea]|uniref:Uncharacterized protein n=1 Tax=Patella caerulea TaxID=87958 RepID=A0AAN8G1K3_PATCE